MNGCHCTTVKSKAETTRTNCDPLPGSYSIDKGSRKNQRVDITDLILCI